MFVNSSCVGARPFFKAQSLTQVLISFILFLAIFGNVTFIPTSLFPFHCLTFVFILHALTPFIFLFKIIRRETSLCRNLLILLGAIPHTLAIFVSDNCR